MNVACDESVQTIHRQALYEFPAAHSNDIMNCAAIRKQHGMD